MLSHEELVARMLANPEVKGEYDALVEEYAIYDEQTRTRERSKSAMNPQNISKRKN